MDRDRIVLSIYDQLLDLEQRLIPVGLHTFGSSPEPRQLTDILFAIASFDRPELGIRSLPDLIAEALGLGDYRGLLAASARSESRASRKTSVVCIAICASCVPTIGRASASVARASLRLMGAPS